MRFVIVSGSHRKNAQSLKVSRYLQTSLRRIDNSNDVSILSLSENPLPLWEEDRTEKVRTIWDPMAQQLRTADALVIVSPEWSGMVPAGLKNFFLFCSADLVGHKPALPVTVSAARGGAYPINELRTSGYKNSRVCYVPEHIIVRNAESMLNDDEPADEDDRFLRRRIDYALAILTEYAKALIQVRESGVIDHTTFPNGMS